MIRKESPTNQPLLQVGNGHAADCSTPPSLDVPGNYLAYFENRRGEQWVFVGDRDARTAVVYGGDIGWDNPQHLTADEPCPDVVLSESERLWIVLCFAALTGERVSEVARRYDAHTERIARRVQEELRRRGDAREP
jgi:hypothetical protein